MIPANVLAATEDRYARRQAARGPVAFGPGVPTLLQENPPDRLARRLRRLGVTPAAAGSSPGPTSFAPTAPAGHADAVVLERILGAQSNLLSIAFLERGLEVARAVGRIVVHTPQGGWYGTGFLVSPRLLLTNNHVLPEAAAAAGGRVEFNYQRDFSGRPLTPTAFALDPAAFFVTDAALDFTLVAVAERGDDGRGLDPFGWNKLIADEGKVVVREAVNIVQHPSGEPKQLALRENRVTDILDDFLQYRTDTAPGSSGSPVFNDQWEVVGLHHSGVPARDAQGRILATNGQPWTEELGEQAIRWVANEGVRVSRILRALQGLTLGDGQRRLRAQVFEADPGRPAASPAPAVVPPPQPAVPGEAAADAGGAIGTWTIPLVVTVRLGSAGPSAAVAAAPPPAPAEPAELTRALAELAAAAGRTYYDAGRDATDRAAYYGDLPGPLSPGDLYQRLHRLLQDTHTRPQGYSPGAQLYPWVDLQPDRTIVSIYSRRPFAPEALIRADFEVDRRRAERLRERLAVEAAGPAALARELDLLEAQLPYNCEHVVPQSWFQKREPMRGDLHHLFACEVNCNSFRGNTPYFDFPDFQEAVRTDCGKKEGDRFEPGGGKGAVARATLYFLLRHPGVITAYRGDRLTTLLAWHKANPVGEYERHRNQAIFEKQGNRNALIDFPEWADRIDFRPGLG